MRNRFDEQLEKLNIELIKMGALCEDAISAAVSALIEGNEEMAQKVYAADSEIDQKERDIEALCLKLLLQQQPVARDLRVISSALKMISDMERIGDQASDIAEITKFIKNNDTKSKIHINDMAKAAIHMVTDSIESFVKKDLALAKSVMDYDDVVEDVYKRQGLGGGSSIDSSKAIAIMATNPGDYWDYIWSGTGKNQPVKIAPLPIVAITTTAGTGTEACLLYTSSRLKKISA